MAETVWADTAAALAAHARQPTGRLITLADTDETCEALKKELAAYEAERRAQMTPEQREKLRVFRIVERQRELRQARKGRG